MCKEGRYQGPKHPAGWGLWREPVSNIQKEHKISAHSERYSFFGGHASNSATHRKRVLFYYFTWNQKKHFWDSLASTRPLVPCLCGWEMKNRIPITNNYLYYHHMSLGMDRPWVSIWVATGLWLWLNGGNSSDSPYPMPSGTAQPGFLAFMVWNTCMPFCCIPFNVNNSFQSVFVLSNLCLTCITTSPKNKLKLMEFYQQFIAKEISPIVGSEKSSQLPLSLHFHFF